MYLSPNNRRSGGLYGVHPAPDILLNQDMFIKANRTFVVIGTGFFNVDVDIKTRKPI